MNNFDYIRSEKERKITKAYDYMQMKNGLILLLLFNKKYPLFYLRIVYFISIFTLCDLLFIQKCIIWDKKN